MRIVLSHWYLEKVAVVFPGYFRSMLLATKAPGFLSRANGCVCISELGLASLGVQAIIQGGWLRSLKSMFRSGPAREIACEGLPALCSVIGRLCRRQPAQPCRSDSAWYFPV